MAEFTDEKPELTPLVIGLTRPPMMWGIPLNAFYIIVGVTLIAFLVSASFWSAGIAPVTYLALFALCIGGFGCPADHHDAPRTGLSPSKPIT